MCVFSVTHFSRLYESKLHKDRALHAFIDEVNVPRLSENEMTACEEPIALEECKDVLDKMARNKAAWILGLTNEFFAFF